MSLSYRNQSIDLFCKSMDWFLYDRDLRFFIKPHRGDHFFDPLHLRSLFPSCRSSRPELLCKKDVHFAKNIGKHPYWSLFFNETEHFAGRASSPLHSTILGGAFGAGLRNWRGLQKCNV